MVFLIFQLIFLMDENFQNNKIYNDENFLTWKERWKERLKLNNNTPEKYLRLMNSVNPLVIPRNHKVEEVLNILQILPTST